MTTASPYGRVAAGYRIVGRLRRGPDATVYHAVREADDAAVALKVLRTDAHVDTELAQVRRLPHHPGIVRVLDTGRTLDGRPYLAMEYYPDGSYADLLRNDGPVSVDEAVRVGIAIADALRATHDFGLVHRDVTPDNILRGAKGPALTDFGIAAVPGELAGTVALDRLTPPHASPEALLRQPQDARSDIYSLGSTLWTLLAGYPPFATSGDASPDPFEYRERALREPVAPVASAEVPQWLQATLARSMAKAPEERYPTAAAFATALREENEPWQEPVLLSPPVIATVVSPVPEPVAPLAATSLGNLAEPRKAPDLDPGWWAPDTNVATAPPELYFPEDAERRRGSGRVVLATSAVVALLAVVGLTVFLLAPVVRQGFAGPGSAQTPPIGVTTLTPTAVAGIAPQDLRLADERIAVTLTWRDLSDGEAAFYVVGTPRGGSASTLANAARGKTSVRVNGLNPTVEYCFVVVAVLSVDEVGNGDEICTHRFSTPTPTSVQPSP